MATKNSLRPRETGITMQVKPPPIRAKMPQINLAPEIKVDAADMSGIEGALRQLATSFEAIAQAQSAILQALSEQAAALQKLAERNVSVKVDAPKMPARPTSFNVEVDRPNGERVSMRVSANKPN